MSQRPFCFLEFLQIFRACNFLNQCLPHQITCHTSSYLSVLLDTGIFNFTTFPWARVGRGSYFLLHLPTFRAKIFILLKYKSIPRSLVWLPTSFQVSSWCVGGFLCSHGWQQGRTQEDLDETTASVYITEYFPCSRTNKRQDRILIKYLWSRPGTPNDYTHFPSERETYPLQGLATQTKLTL